MQGGLIAPDHVERFRADLQALTFDPPASERRLGLAVSGGADSLALLLLAYAAWPGAIAAATVDHGLRVEAAAEAAHVGSICAQLRVPHATLRAPSAPPASGNLQDRARALRYELLHRWAQANGVHHLATAHQRDDVAESFLQRASRGAGVRGLAAMPAVRTLDFGTVLLIRPLLGWSRAELAGIVATAGLTPVGDPSNADPRFDRARYRQLLAANPDLTPAGLALTAAHLRDAEEVLEWTTQREVADRLSEDDAGNWLDGDGLPFELRRRLVVRAIEAVRQRHGRFEPWRVTAVADLVRALDAGRGGTVADVQGRFVKGRWHFRLAPPRRTG